MMNDVTFEKLFNSTLVFLFLNKLEYLSFDDRNFNHDYKTVLKASGNDEA